MRLRLLLILGCLLACLISARAAHIAGGELFYSFEKMMPDGKYHYRVTLRLFRECSSTGPRLEAETVNMGAYDAVNKNLVTSILLSYTGSLQVIRLNASAIPCISGDTNVCYQVALYQADIYLTNIPNGYILAWSRCCRANGIINIGGGTSVSATYTAFIPFNAPANNSPVMNVRDTALVCAGKNFVLDFGGTDADNDSLSYSFTPAYGGPNSQGTNAPPNLSLPLLNYSGVYTGEEPLGAQVIINPRTGAITGTAPLQSGRYVVNVTITEWRNGQQISYHRKDFIIKVGACDFVEARLQPIINCNSFTTLFENLSSSAANLQYSWNFGDNSTMADTSSRPQPSYTYTDTGIYKIRLEVTGAGGCKATDSSTVSVFPGFRAGFKTLGLCFRVPVQFLDTSTVRYGQINIWRWNFGDPSTLADTARTKNSQYKYAQPGIVPVKLYVSSTKGCTDSVTLSLPISSEPTFELPVSQPLCKGDTLQIPLQIEGNPATFQWTPPVFISSPSVPRPLVFPPQTGSYQVTVSQDGCTGSKSTLIRIIENLELTVQQSGGNCTGDTARLQAISEGNMYQWTPVSRLSAPNAKETLAWPDTSTRYVVRSQLGSCVAEQSVLVVRAPVPLVNAGPDTSLCLGTAVQLQGKIRGNSFRWFSSDGSLNNTTVLNPRVRPVSNTRYVLTVSGNEACTRQVRDTISISVNPLPEVRAGNDTNVINGIPFTLTGAGADGYEWMPARFFTNPFQPQQIVRLPAGITPVLLVLKGSNSAGCIAYDSVVVTQFDGGPDIFVPTAFSPNADGRNDRLRAIPAGVQLRSFRIYNRLGNEVFTTSSPAEGWNGLFRGLPQPPGTYVFVAEGVDGQNRQVLRRGTTVLIR